MAILANKIALALLLAFAALFETTRDSLYRLGNSVGGVGGVSGLTNQWQPEPWCNHTKAYTKLYCYEPGILGGLTPYAVITTLFWTSPLLIIAIGAILNFFCESSSRPNDEESSRFWKGDESTDDAHAGEGKQPLLISTVAYTTTNGKKEETITRNQSNNNNISLEIFKWGWFGISLIWFLNPLCAYLDDSFYQKDGLHIVLGISLSASFPLSWSAMLVSLPMAQNSIGEVLATSFGLKTKVDRAQLHIYMAKSTLLWLLVHGGGELIYLGGTKQLASYLTLTSAPGGWVSSNGENLLYVFGLVTFILALCHMLIGFLRNYMRPIFNVLHLPVALLLLLTATVHWWPFAFFMLPAVITHGHNIAVRRFHSSPSQSVSSQRQKLQQQQLASSTALLVSFVSLTGDRFACSLKILICLSCPSFLYL